MFAFNSFSSGAPPSNASNAGGGGVLGGPATPVFGSHHNANNSNTPSISSHSNTNNSHSSSGFAAAPPPVLGGGSGGSGNASWASRAPFTPAGAAAPLSATPVFAGGLSRSASASSDSNIAPPTFAAGPPPAYAPAAPTSAAPVFGGSHPAQNNSGNTANNRGSSVSGIQNTHNNTTSGGRNGDGGVLGAQSGAPSAQQPNVNHTHAPFAARPGDSPVLGTGEGTGSQGGPAAPLTNSQGGFSWAATTHSNISSGTAVPPPLPVGGALREPFKSGGGSGGGGAVLPAASANTLTFAAGAAPPNAGSMPPPQHRKIEEKPSFGNSFGQPPSSQAGFSQNKSGGGAGGGSGSVLGGGSFPGVLSSTSSAASPPPPAFSATPHFQSNASPVVAAVERSVNRSIESGNKNTSNSSTNSSNAPKESRAPVFSSGNASFLNAPFGQAAAAKPPSTPSSQPLPTTNTSATSSLPSSLPRAAAFTATSSTHPPESATTSKSGGAPPPPPSSSVFSSAFGAAPSSAAAAQPSTKESSFSSAAPATVTSTTSAFSSMAAQPSSAQNTETVSLKSNPFSSAFSAGTTAPAPAPAVVPVKSVFGAAATTAPPSTGGSVFTASVAGDRVAQDRRHNSSRNSGSGTAGPTATAITNANAEPNQRGRRRGRSRSPPGQKEHNTAAPSSVFNADRRSLPHSSSAAAASTAPPPPASTTATSSFAIPAPRHAQPQQQKQQHTFSQNAHQRVAATLSRAKDLALPTLSADEKQWSLASRVCKSFLLQLASPIAAAGSRETGAAEALEQAFFGVAGREGVSGDYATTAGEMLAVWQRHVLPMVTSAKAADSSALPFPGEVWVALFSLGTYLNVILSAVTAATSATSMSARPDLIAYKAGLREHPLEALTDACHYANELSELLLTVFQRGTEAEAPPYSVIPVVLRRVRSVFDESTARGVAAVQSNLKAVTQKLFAVLNRRVKVSAMEVINTPGKPPRWLLTYESKEKESLLHSFAYLLIEMIAVDAPMTEDVENFIAAFHECLPSALAERCMLYYRRACAVLRQPLRMPQVEETATLLAKAIAVYPPDAPPHNRRVLEVKLLTTELALGRLPSDSARVALDVPQLTDVVNALKTARLDLLDAALKMHGPFFVQIGVHNVLMVLRQRISLLMVVKYYLTHNLENKLNVTDMVRYHNLPYSTAEAALVWLLPLLVEKCMNGVLDHEYLILSGKAPFDDYARDLLAAPAAQ